MISRKTSLEKMSLPPNTTMSNSSQRGIPLPSDDLVIAAALTALVLLIFQLKTIGVGVFSIVVVTAAVLKRDRLIANVNVRFVAIILGVGLLSTAWSQDRIATLYYGIQIVLTALAGLILASSGRPYSTLLGATISFAGYAVLSHLFGHYVPWEDGRSVFVGLTEGKNYYGGISGATALLSLALVYASMNRRHFLVTGFALVGFVAGALGLVRSLATGFTISAFVVCCLIIYLNVYRVLSPKHRLGLMLYVIYAGVCIGALVAWLHKDISTFFLAALHKDPTLTGRTQIWDIANDAIRHNFWLGTGQSAFWLPGNPFAERIWLANNMSSKSYFPLHNTYLEIMASLGFVGLCANVGVAGILLFKQIRALFLTPTTLQIGWMAISFYFFFLMGVESFNLGAMNYNSIILTCALAFSPPLPAEIKGAANSQGRAGTVKPADRDYMAA